MRPRIDRSLAVSVIAVTDGAGFRVDSRKQPPERVVGKVPHAPLAGVGVGDRGVSFLRNLKQIAQTVIAVLGDEVIEVQRYAFRVESTAECP